MSSGVVGADQLLQDLEGQEQPTEDGGERDGQTDRPPHDGIKLGGYSIGEPPSSSSGSVVSPGA